MKVLQLIAMAVIICTVSIASAEEYAVEKNEWLHIPVEMPENKAGGGDFYTLKLEPREHGSPIEYELLQREVKIRSATVGKYEFNILVNHVTKSSCAGVEINMYSSDLIRVYVKD